MGPSENVKTEIWSKRNPKKKASVETLTSKSTVLFRLSSPNNMPTTIYIHKEKQSEPRKIHKCRYVSVLCTLYQRPQCMEFKRQSLYTNFPNIYNLRNPSYYLPDSWPFFHKRKRIIKIEDHTFFFLKLSNQPTLPYNFNITNMWNNGEMTVSKKCML